MSTKGLVTALLVLVFIAGLQGLAWFLAMSCGYQFGTQDYGNISVSAALFSVCIAPGIVAARHSS